MTTVWPSVTERVSPGAFFAATSTVPSTTDTPVRDDFFPFPAPLTSTLKDVPRTDATAVGEFTVTVLLLASFSIAKKALPLSRSNRASVAAPLSLTRASVMRNSVFS